MTSYVQPEGWPIQAAELRQTAPQVVKDVSFNPSLSVTLTPFPDPWSVQAVRNVTVTANLYQLREDMALGSDALELSQEVRLVGGDLSDYRVTFRSASGLVRISEVGTYEFRIKIEMVTDNRGTKKVVWSRQRYPKFTVVEKWQT